MALNYPTDTYISLEDAREYADVMGLSLPTDDADAEALLKRSAIYLDRLYGARYIGNRTNSSYLLYWPRTVLSYYDSMGNYRADLTYTSVPVELGQAQVELASMMYDDFDPFVQPEPQVKMVREKLGAIETTMEYADSSGYASSPFYKLDVLLAPLIRTGNVSKRITSTRGA